MKRKSVLIQLLFLFSCNIYSQLNKFDKHMAYYYDNGVDYHNLVQTNDKGYALCRGAYDTLSHLYVCELIKCDKAGTPVWAKQLNKSVTGTEKFNTNSMIKTADGGLLIGTSVSSSGNPQIVLVKTDNVGTIEWSEKYPAEGLSTVTCIKQTSDLGYIISGSTTDTVNQQFAYIFKIDASGNYDWGKKCVISGNATGSFSAVDEIPGQGYIAAGSSGSFALIVKLDLAGNLVWDKNILGFYGSIAAVISTSDSAFVFGGAANDSAMAIYGALKIFKTDRSGNMLWMKSISPTSSYYNGSYISDIHEKMNGDFVLSGYLADPIPTQMLTQIDKDGNVKWCQQYYYTYHTFNYQTSSFQITTDMGFVYCLLGGTHTGAGATNNFSTVLVKTDSTGIVDCDGNSYPLNLINYSSVPLSNTVISNSGSASSYSATFSSVAFIPDTVICETILDVPTAGILENVEQIDFEIYPNPAENELTVLLAENNPGNIIFSIYDVMGRMVSMKKQETQKDVMSIDISNLQSGMYLLKVMDGEKSTTKRFVKK
jgi:hypothetical protein